MKAITIALPSKGRIQEDMNRFLNSAGISIIRDGDQRTYTGHIKEFEDIKIRVLSANEIAMELQAGNVQLGITGLDLISELDNKISKEVIILSKLGFSKANVVVAIPNSWIDVSNTQDLSEVTRDFLHIHERRLRVATKFERLTRNFFNKKGINNYRIVESTGATEGSPSSGTSELIVDITSSGKTLEANNLRVLNDGIILKSEACIFASKSLDWGKFNLNPVEKLLRTISARSEAINKVEMLFEYLSYDDSLELDLFRKFNGIFSGGTPNLGDAVSLIIPEKKSSSCSQYLTSKGNGPIRINKPNLIYFNIDSAWQKLKTEIDL